MKWHFSLSRCFVIYSELNSFYQLEVSLVMTWIGIVILLLFSITARLVAENMRSFRMSIMTGWQFKCAQTTCLPFASVTTSNVRRCQIACLAQVQCQAVSFQQSTSNCELFANIPNQNGNMVAQVEIVTMIVIDETRMPPG
jgi:hypothetical protein